MPDNRGTGRNRLQRNRVASADNRRANVKPEDTRDPVKNPGADEAVSAQPQRPNLLNSTRGRGRATYGRADPFDDATTDGSGRTPRVPFRNASDITSAERKKAIRQAIQNIGKKG